MKRVGGGHRHRPNPCSRITWATAASKCGLLGLDRVGDRIKLSRNMSGWVFGGDVLGWRAKRKGVVGAVGGSA